MRLFKFVGSTSAVRNMATGSLKFTPIEELNDPSELPRRSFRRPGRGGAVPQPSLFSGLQQSMRCGR